MCGQPIDDNLKLALASTVESAVRGSQRGRRGVTRTRQQGAASRKPAKSKKGWYYQDVQGQTKQRARAKA